jgi:mRNA-degrading endonuclease RelE of RelBE toxin-antitoxin system
MAYRIEYDPEAEADMRALRPVHRPLARDGIERHLRHDAEVDSGARKRLRPNPVAQWRLRLDPLRVYYDVERGTVWIKAVYVKERARLYRRGAEVRLDE